MDAASGFESLNETKELKQRHECDCIEFIDSEIA